MIFDGTYTEVCNTIKIAWFYNDLLSKQVSNAL